MKRIILLCLLSLQIVIVYSSEITYPTITNDSLITITSNQLKTANLIFVEHSKLTLENLELRNQVSLYDSALVNCFNNNNIYEKQISIMNDDLNTLQYKVEKQQGTIDRYNKIFTIGGMSIGIALLLIILVK